MTTARAHDGRTPAQILALTIGVVYTIVGIAGFFVVQEFVGDLEQGDELLGFALNGLHNVVHILIGVAGIAAASSVAGARSYGYALLLAYGLVFVYGLFTAGTDPILNLNWADNWLHLFSAIAGLVIVILPSRRTAT